jgi:RND family efflux transporter MFP subunit
MSTERPNLADLRIDPRAREEGGGRGRLIAVVVAAVLLAVVGGVLALQSRAVKVETATARTVTGSQAAAVLNASGYVTPRVRATVAAKITARVKELLVEEGMRVEAGQVLARLDDSDAQRRLAASRAELEVARAAIADLEVQLANAEKTQARQMDLRREGVSAAETLDNAITAVDSLRARIVLSREQVRAAQATVAIAEQDVENCTVRAPFAGIAVSKDAQVGEMVSPVSAGGGFTRTGISTIVDMASLEIEVDVNESYIARVSPGQRVEASLDAYPDWRMPASVRTVIPTADRQKATVKVRISFAALDPRILPDMGVKVAFLTDAPAGGAVETAARTLVPRAAIRNEGGQDLVFLVDNGKLERRAVRLGAARGDDVEVLAGVAGGEAVVVGGPASLKDGQRAKVKS